jgi:four helix bundle protein
MGTIDKFEDIEAWKKARELTRKIYTITSKGDFSKDYGLKDQIRRASVSVMSNIAEGFERDGNKEFRQFLSMAKGSAAEVRSQLYVAFDSGYLEDADFQTLNELAVEAGRLIGGLMRYLEKSRHKGTKFKY